MNYAMSTSKDLIIKSAISEFLKFGYKKASLRNIAKGAGLTTGAFYNYFESKLDLFEVLVAPYEKYYLDHCAQVREMLETASVFSAGAVLQEAGYQRARDIHYYIYDHYDNYMLLLNSSEGTDHENFIERLIDDEVNRIIDYFTKNKASLKNNVVLDRDFCYSLTKAQFTELFANVRAERDCEVCFKKNSLVKQFYEAGWTKIMNEVF